MAVAPPFSYPWAPLPQAQLQAPVSVQLLSLAPYSQALLREPLQALVAAQGVTPFGAEGESRGDEEERFVVWVGQEGNLRSGR